MFNTYIQMDKLSLPAFIFSKIYLYVFISLFIYVVLSVFISLISDTYETLHVSKCKLIANNLKLEGSDWKHQYVQYILL